MKSTNQNTRKQILNDITERLRDIAPQNWTLKDESRMKFYEDLFGEVRMWHYDKTYTTQLGGLLYNVRNESFRDYTLTIKVDNVFERFQGGLIVNRQIRRLFKHVEKNYKTLQEEQSKKEQEIREMRHRQQLEKIADSLHQPQEVVTQ